jgi:hypothetical protein
MGKTSLDPGHDDAMWARKQEKCRYKAWQPYPNNPDSGLRIPGDLNLIRYL